MKAVRREAHISITKNVIKFTLRGELAGPPEVFKLNGLDERQDLVTEWTPVIETRSPARKDNEHSYYCAVGRGIYLLQTGPHGMLVLLPERLEIDSKTAVALLAHGLPDPSEFEPETAAELKFFLARGLSWPAAMRRITLSRGGSSTNNQPNKVP
jgi:hypothetical protein